MSQTENLRLANGGRINRSLPVSFQYNGQTINAFEGDSAASALLATGEKVFARSFKYHRPRGILSAGIEEPNALFTTGSGATQEPNVVATQLEAFNGLSVKTQNAWPSVHFDLMSVNSLLSPVFVAGFYYKTFMPSLKAWMFFEHFIRRAAGLGKNDNTPDQDRYDYHNDYVDVLVIGSGIAGLSAAFIAATSGATVLLVEQDFALGGALLNRPVDSDEGKWLDQTLASLLAMPNVKCLTRATAFGLYDGNTVGVIERSHPMAINAKAGVPKSRFRTVRASAIVMAAGSIEQPMVFAGNDTPGVMLSSAVGAYVNRYAIQIAKNAIFTVNNDAAYLDAFALAKTGAKVHIADVRESISPTLLAQVQDLKIELSLSSSVIEASGSKGVQSCRLAKLNSQGEVLSMGPVITTELIAMSGGFTPTVHLTSHRSIKPVYNPTLGCFVPGGFDKTHFGAGAMMGHANWRDSLNSGLEAGAKAAACVDGLAASTPSNTLNWSSTDAASLSFARAPLAVASGQKNKAVGKGKAFIDFQHDVTVDDLTLAHREGFVAVEHIKRYSTLGMATDQGKTANANALAILAQERGLDVSQVGTTTFRPPYSPASLGALAGRAVGRHFQPVRRTAMHNWHLANKGEMTEAGYWMRPLWFSSNGADLSEAYKAEMLLVRQGVGVADVSTLGKIDVQGPDAAEFLDRVYVNGFSKLAVGKARYGFMLREDGIVMDDGTTTRLAQDRFFMTTTTAQAAKVMSHLEFLLQVVWPNLRVTVASVSDQWAAMSLAGPKVRDLLRKALPQINFDNEAFPFMGAIDSVGTGALEGMPIRVVRLTFSGELAYEIYVPTHFGQTMWSHLFTVGAEFNLKPYGLESLGSLRIEKGHVVGSEMDGRTTLDDLGAGAMASKTKSFWGDTLRRSENLARNNRPTLVGLEPVNPSDVVLNGAILFFPDDEIKGHGRGHVTSNAYSAEVGAHIALGLVQGGKSKIGQEVVAVSPVRNSIIRLKIVDPCFLDAAGERYRI